MRRCGGVVIAGGRGGELVIWLRRRGRPLADSELDPDLALGSTRGAAELEGLDRICGSTGERCLEIDEVLEGKSGGADEGLGGLGGLGVENVDGKGEGRVVRGEGEGKVEALVPNRAGGSGVVGFGGGATLGIEVGDSVGLEVAVAPVNVLEMLCGDDSDLEINGLHSRRRRRRVMVEMRRRGH